MSTESVKNANGLLIAGIVTYIIAWLVPAHQEINTGYNAYLATCNNLFELEDVLSGGGPFLDKIMLVIMAITPHTNYLLIIILILLLTRKNTASTSSLSIMKNSLLICFILNLVYLYLFKDNIASLRIGYYLWLASFLLVSLAAGAFRPGKTTGAP